MLTYSLFCLHIISFLWAVICILSFEMLAYQCSYVIICCLCPCLPLQKLTASLPYYAITMEMKAVTCFSFLYYKKTLSVHPASDHPLVHPSSNFPAWLWRSLMSIFPASNRISPRKYKSYCRWWRCLGRILAANEGEMEQLSYTHSLCTHLCFVKGAYSTQRQRKWCVKCRRPMVKTL